MARIVEGANRATPEEAASFVDKFEELEAEIASEKGASMARCKAIRKRQDEVLDDAKSQGVPKGLVKAIHKARDLEAKAKAAMNALEDDKDYAVDIRKALGDYADLPLGQAAVEKADGTAGIVETVKADMGDEELRRAKLGEDRVTVD